MLGVTTPTKILKIIGVITPMKIIIILVVTTPMKIIPVASKPLCLSRSQFNDRSIYTYNVQGGANAYKFVQCTAHCTELIVYFITRNPIIVCGADVVD